MRFRIGHSFFLFAFGVVPVDREEELNGLLVRPVRRQPETDDGQTREHVDRVENRHRRCDVLPIVVNVVPPPHFVGRTHVKDVNQNQLIRFPRERFLQFQFQQTPADAGERRARLENERLGPVVKPSVVENGQEKAVEGEEMVHVQFFGEGVVFDVEVDQRQFFEDEETGQDGEEGPALIGRRQDVIFGQLFVEKGQTKR